MRGRMTSIHLFRNIDPRGGCSFQPAYDLSQNVFRCDRAEAPAVGAFARIIARQIAMSVSMDRRNAFQDPDTLLVRVTGEHNVADADIR